MNRIHIKHLHVRLTVCVRLPVRLTVGLTLPRCAFVVRKGGGTVRLTVPITVPITLARGVYNLWAFSFFFFFFQISSFI